ncbi:MAG TPA: hypothetical protein VKX46_13965, partial [Ktedonobacteraceae bacterium]|nr:hypothetical protein [Ktedonobacteraceae bacterium]
LLIHMVGVELGDDEPTKVRAGRKNAQAAHRLFRLALISTPFGQSPMPPSGNGVRPLSSGTFVVTSADTYGILLMKEYNGADASHVLSVRRPEKKRQRLRALYASKKWIPLASLHRVSNVYVSASLPAF